LSPFKGQRYTHPVELIDIFPTVNDLVAAPPFDRKKFCVDLTKIYTGCRSITNKDGQCLSSNVLPPNAVCRELQGKSLAKVSIQRTVFMAVYSN
jgi:hypothetical protein